MDLWGDIQRGAHGQGMLPAQGCVCMLLVPWELWPVGSELPLLQVLDRRDHGSSSERSVCLGHTRRDSVRDGVAHSHLPPAPGTHNWCEEGVC